MGYAVSTREREREIICMLETISLSFLLCVYLQVCVCLIIIVFVCLIDLVSNKDSVFDWYDFFVYKFEIANS